MHIVFLISAHQGENIFFITNENLSSERLSSPGWAKNCGICPNIILKLSSSILGIAEMYTVKLFAHTWLQYFAVYI